MAFAEISSDGSSDSGSSGTGVGVLEGAVATAGAAAGREGSDGTGFGGALSVAVAGAVSVVFAGSTGVSSTVECFPVVHGGMSKNSSKVRTRGLQHFQPVPSIFLAYRITYDVLT